MPVPGLKPFRIELPSPGSFAELFAGGIRADFIEGWEDGLTAWALSRPLRLRR